MEIRYDTPVMRATGQRIAALSADMNFQTRGTTAASEAQAVASTAWMGRAGRSAVRFARSTTEANVLACRNLTVLGENVIATADAVDAGDRAAAASLAAEGGS